MFKTIKNDFPKILKEGLLIDLVSPLLARDKYIPEYRKGNFSVVGVTIAVNDGYDKTKNSINEWKKRFIEMQDAILHVRSVNDIYKAHSNQKLGIILHFQNTAPLEENISRIEEFYALGVRVMQLTYNSKNAFGCGCEVEVDTGLTDLGCKLIDKMNSVGMLLDLSHAGYKTAQEAIEYSKQASIFSHSNAYALCNSDRNIPDTLIDLIHQKKGCIGVNAFPYVVAKKGQPSLDLFIDHIDYITERIGIDFVSLGLDYYTGQYPYVSTKAAVANYDSLIKRGIWNTRNYPKPPHKYPKGIETPATILNLKKGLIQRGYSTENILKIMGENLIGLFSKVWK